MCYPSSVCNLFQLFFLPLCKLHAFYNVSEVEFQMMDHFLIQGKIRAKHHDREE